MTETVTQEQNSLEVLYMDLRFGPSVYEKLTEFFEERQFDEIKGDPRYTSPTSRRSVQIPTLLEGVPVVISIKGCRPDLSLWGAAAVAGETRLTEILKEDYGKCSLDEAVQEISKWQLLCEANPVLVNQIKSNQIKSNQCFSPTNPTAKEPRGSRVRLVSENF